MTKNKSSLRTDRRALLQILSADIIWGLGFVLAQWTLLAWTPVLSSVLRFFFAFALCLVFYAAKKQLYSFEIKRAMIPGFLNGAVLIFQTWGLLYTEVTKVGFITTLYVVFVPLLERIFWKRKLSALHWLWVFLALTGTLIISGASFEKINRGDLLTLACSLCAALHIISISDLDLKISPFRFNMWQCGWSLLVSIIAAVIFESSQKIWPSMEWSHPNTQKALAGMAGLVVLSSILAFSLQAQAQRWLSPSVAGLLYLGECIFGAIFAFFLVGERMSLVQWSGALLILVAALGVIRLETRALSVKPAVG